MKLLHSHCFCRSELKNCYGVLMSKIVPRKRPVSVQDTQSCDQTILKWDEKSNFIFTRNV